MGQPFLKLISIIFDPIKEIKIKPKFLWVLSFSVFWSGRKNIYCQQTNDRGLSVKLAYTDICSLKFW